MKGQFFVMATVIMIYTLMTLTQYLYSFSDINLVQLKKMSEFYYIPEIKNALNETALSSNTSLDCSKLNADLNSTENFLKQELISRGITLEVNHSIVTCPQTCPPNCPSFNVSFNFSLKTSNLYTFTQFNIP